MLHTGAQEFDFGLSSKKFIIVFKIYHVNILYDSSILDSLDSAAGHLVTLKHYRETGTTSKEVEQESFVRKIKSENIA